MASLIKRSSVRRSDRKPVYTFDGSSDEENFVQEMDQTTEQVEGRNEIELVNPLAKIEKILDFEYRPTTFGDPIPDNREPNSVFVKQYLVKWKGISYLHCCWVPEKEFVKGYKFNPLLKTRVNKFHSKMESEKKEDDEFVAIRPEWTTVDRIIACRELEGDLKQYLVKYQELTYDECYWEDESDISAFQNEIQRFKDINSGTRRDRYVQNEIYQEEFKQFDHTPDYLTGSLHPYQLEGLNFLKFSWWQETNVILADEMGLGKTIQSIAFLASLFEENIAPHLVVAPLSTLRNWEREFALWTPQLNVVMYTGTYKARDVIREHEFYFTKEKKTKFDVLLTSYEIINVDTPLLKTIKWKSMIVDEGHRLKNKDSKLFTSLKQFKSQHRVLLTGTPLQNNLDELFVLMHFLDAGKFGRLETFEEEFKEINQEEQILRLHEMLAPHMLRRIKKDVLKDMIPPKKVLILRVDLSNQQKALYKAIITRNYKILAKRGGGQISNVLMELRKVCSHPYLVEGESDVEDTDEALKQLVEASGKLELLDKMMVKLKEQGHRVLIYCQFRGMLDLLEDYCSYKNWYYERIDGMVSGAERQVRIDRFNTENSNRFCFLLSTRAGGIGINLATADTVIIYDSDWNPHADIQAMARAHRLGQTNKVMIYRLINRSTVEERMMQITKKKMVLEHLVVGKLKTPNLSQEDLDDIIKYGSKELFSEENEEARKSGKIHYDDASIEKLLDRDQVDAEVSEDDVEDNNFLQAFKVASFECIDENEAAASEQPQANENKPSASVSDRKNYWEDLLKDKQEAHQTEELNALGKRKRNCKQLISMKEDDEMSCDENDDAEPSAGQGTVHRYPKGIIKRFRRKAHQADNSEPKPLIEGEGESLRVLGFNKSERKTFRLTVMRYGLGNSDWKEFDLALKYKTYEEIKAYGVLFMKHLLEASNNTSPTYTDGVPKEGLNSSEVLIRIAEILLFHEKCKYFEDHPTSPLFPEPIIQQFVLTRRKCWNGEHDKLLIRSVIKNGFARWNPILVDKEFEIEDIVKKELNLTSSVLGESSLNQTTSTDAASAERFQKRCREFVARRVHLLKEAINYEYSEEYRAKCRSVSVPAGQEETETQAMDTAAEMPDQVPMRQRISMFFANMFRNEANVEKQGRDKVSELYNEMCPNENTGESSVQASLSSQPISQTVRENKSPLESSTDQERSGTQNIRTIHDVDMGVWFEEPGPSSSKPVKDDD